MKKETLGKTTLRIGGNLPVVVKPALRYRFSSALNALAKSALAAVDGGKTAPFYPNNLRAAGKIHSPRECGRGRG